LTEWNLYLNGGINQFRNEKVLTFVTASHFIFLPCLPNRIFFRPLFPILRYPFLKLERGMARRLRAGNVSYCFFRYFKMVTPSFHAPKKLFTDSVIFSLFCSKPKKQKFFSFPTFFQFPLSCVLRVKTALFGASGNHEFQH